MGSSSNPSLFMHHRRPISLHNTQVKCRHQHKLPWNQNPPLLYPEFFFPSYFSPDVKAISSRMVTMRRGVYRIPMTFFECLSKKGTSRDSEESVIRRSLCPPSVHGIQRFFEGRSARRNHATGSSVTGRLTSIGFVIPRLGVSYLLPSMVLIGHRD